MTTTIYIQMPAGRIMPVWNFENVGTNISDSNSQLIHAAIETYFGYSLDMLKVKNRKRELVFPRQIGMYLHTKLTRYALETIGEIYNRDHTTVMHGRDTIIDFLTSRGEEKYIIQDFFKTFGFEL